MDSYHTEMLSASDKCIAVQEARFGFLVNIDVPYSVEHKKLGFLTELYQSPINISRSFGVFKYTQ